MKSVAGSLRLNLAQYREMEAFARFGTDLDETTLQQLERGRRLVELLKQNQYVPMPVAEQVVVIFAGVNGYLDDVDTGDILKFEKEYLDHMRSEHHDILDTIATQKVISDDLKDRLGKIVDEFKSGFSGHKEAESDLQSIDKQQEELAKEIEENKKEEE